MSQPNSEQAATRKRRSSVERVIVWGAIAALVVVAAFEFRSHRGFSRAYNPLVSQLRASDAKGGSVKEKDVRAAVQGMQPVSRQAIYGIMRTADREDTYVWPGLLKNRTMYVYYGVGQNPDVLFVTNVKEPPPAPFDWEAFGYVRVDQPPPSEDAAPAATE